MLDYKRLETNSLLIKSGWTPSHNNLLQKGLSHLNLPYQLQVPVSAIFESAREIVDALDGICIRNQCTERGLGSGCNAVEFDFFEYDTSVYPELEAVRHEIGKQVVYIGVGYDIIGDWLVDETGVLYFQNKIEHTLLPFSHNIYDFLEKDIYKFPSL